MMEKIKKFNLELCLFAKELNSYTETVNEIDDETTKLLIEIILAVDHLQASSKNHKKLASNENQFISYLDEGIFKVRRCIVCHLCHDHISLDSEDFELHLQRRSHKMKETEQKLSREKLNGIGIGQTEYKSLYVTKNEKETKLKVTGESPNSLVDSENSNSYLTQSKTKEAATSISIHSNVLKFEDMIKTDIISATIVEKMIDFVSRRKERIQSEEQILQTLIGHCITIDSKLQLSPFGSATYGYGSNIDFNILANAGDSDKSPLTLLQSLEKYFKTACLQDDFEIFDTISGNRVQKRRLQLLHRKSRIMCRLEFRFDCELTETSQIIRDYIKHGPICYHLIAYIKSLQGVLISQNGADIQHFNTYIISILVIFFLQVNYNFPKIKDLPKSQTQSINAPPKVDREFLEQTVVGFFNFYGTKYEVAKDLISLNIGKLQKRKLDVQQTKHTPEQKRLRDAIETNPGNWENCTMFIEDIKSPTINVAAEIPEKEAHYFKKFCQILTTFSHKKIIDEYMSKLSSQQAASTANGSDLSVNKFTSMETPSSKSNDTSIISLESLKAAIANAQKEIRDKNPKPSTSKSCENVVKPTREMYPFSSGTDGSLQPGKKFNSSILNLNSVTSVNASGSSTIYSPAFSSPKLNTNSVNSSGIRKTVQANSQETITTITVRSNPVKLEDVVKVDEVSKTIVKEMIDLISRTNRRIQNESSIIKLLTSSLQKLDSTLNFIPFGSSTYGFGSSKTDFNILVNAGGSESNPAVLQHEFEKLMKSSDLQKQFEVFESLAGNRVQKKRLQLLHKSTRVMSHVQFGLNFELAESNQTIRDFINYSPLCYHLIACIRSWQNVLNDVAAEHGKVAFQFNTYIISVLVIFYLQMNHNFPQTKDVPPSKAKHINVVPIIKMDLLKQGVGGFFKFYADRYEISNHLISVNIGRWQERRLQPHQSNFTSEQKRLRNGIETNSVNWKNCTMYAEDIKIPGTNIVAEIPKEEANNFKKMCSLFATSKSYGKLIDEYVTKLSSCQSSSSHASTSATCTSQSMETLLQKRIDFHLVHNTILERCGVLLVEKLLYMDIRECFKKEIISLLTGYIKSIDFELNLIPFGSNQYNLNESGSNFNLFVFTGKSDPAEMFRKFEGHLKSTNIHKHFKEISKINGNRVLKQQISMIHIKSSIHCFLLFDNDNSIPKSSEILNQFNEKVPMCHSLIRFIRTWQKVLNEMYPNGAVIQFQFNTYIISILVIFFFQTNSKTPVIDNIGSIPPVVNLDRLSNLGNINKLARNFFSFYGNNYQIWNHVISVHIGQWQERRLQTIQRNFSAAKKRLRDGIESNPASWNNCTMYVQDLMRTNVNTAAEISRKSVENFQQLCKIFAKNMPKD